VLRERAELVAVRHHDLLRKVTGRYAIETLVDFLHRRDNGPGYGVAEHQRQQKPAEGEPDDIDSGCFICGSARIDPAHHVRLGPIDELVRQSLEPISEGGQLRSLDLSRLAGSSVAGQLEHARGDAAEAGMILAKAAGRDAREEAVCIAVLAAFPDRVARRRNPGGAEVVFAGGGSATLARESAVRDAELLVAVDAEERRTTRANVLVRLASAVEPEWLLDLFPDDLAESIDVEWDPDRERVVAISRLTYQGLVLEESRRPPNASEAPAAAKLLASHAGPEMLLDPEALATLRGRVEAVAGAAPEHGLRKVEDADVRAALEALCEGLSSLEELRNAGVPQLVQLGETLHSWRNEIAAMWRFTRNNGITEGFHNKMELISRQAYGFRNFQNYRLRVKVLCS